MPLYCGSSKLRKSSRLRRFHDLLRRLDFSAWRWRTEKVRIRTVIEITLVFTSTFGSRQIQLHVLLTYVAKVQRGIKHGVSP